MSDAPAVRASGYSVAAGRRGAHHRRAPGVDGSDDLLGVDALQESLRLAWPSCSRRVAAAPPSWPYRWADADSDPSVGRVEARRTSGGHSRRRPAGRRSAAPAALTGSGAANRPTRTSTRPWARRPPAVRVIARSFGQSSLVRAHGSLVGAGMLRWLSRLPDTGHPDFSALPLVSVLSGSSVSRSRRLRGSYLWRCYRAADIAGPSGGARALGEVIGADDAALSQADDLGGVVDEHPDRSRLRADVLDQRLGRVVRTEPPGVLPAPLVRRRDGSVG